MLGVILAGGRSTRMGRDKALLEIGGARVLARNVELLRALCGDILIVARDAVQAESLQLPAVRILTDRVPDCGPLGGLHTALEASGEDLFVLACDMPSLEAPLLKRLAEEFETYRPKLLLPVTADGPQPLCAIWSRSCKADVSAALQARQLALYRLIQGWSDVRRVPISAGDEVQFQNLNSPADLPSKDNL